MKTSKHNAVLSIAGFDPSGGAGLIVDCKVFEEMKEYGCAITTSITYQNDTSFTGLDWLGFDSIQKQFIPLAERFEFLFVKIGLIENFEALNKCIKMLKQYKQDIKIIWDPILKASSGFDFHKQLNKDEVVKVLSEIYLLTPNKDEAVKLLGVNDIQPGAHCNVLVKGGHATSDNSTDILYSNGKVHEFSETRLDGYAKHGSGCVLSAAIIALLNKGHSLQEACREAKQYTLGFLKSSDTLIGHHYYELNYAG